MAPGSDKGLVVPATGLPQSHQLANPDPVIGVVTIRVAGVEVLANNPNAILADGISGVGSFGLWVQPDNGRARGPCPTGQLAPNAAAADTRSRDLTPLSRRPAGRTATLAWNQRDGNPGERTGDKARPGPMSTPRMLASQQPRAGCPHLTRRWSADAPGCGLRAQVRELGAQVFGSAGRYALC
jgi:hypothetical protein